MYAYEAGRAIRQALTPAAYANEGFYMLPKHLMPSNCINDALQRCWCN